jgi:hypothetical protein
MKKNNTMDKQDWVLDVYDEESMIIGSRIIEDSTKEDAMIKAKEIVQERFPNADDWVIN